MKFAVIGSRNFLYLNLVQDLVGSFCDYDWVITGGAQGVDQTAMASAKKAGRTMIVCWPDWDKYGKGAAHVRNREIVDLSDRVFAFWDGSSPGTKYTIDYALTQGKIVTAIGYDAVCKCLSCKIGLWSLKYGFVCYNCCTNKGMENGKLNQIHPKLGIPNGCKNHPESPRDLLLKCEGCKEDEKKSESVSE